MAPRAAGRAQLLLLCGGLRAGVLAWHLTSKSVLRPTCDACVVRVPLPEQGGVGDTRVLFRQSTATSASVVRCHRLRTAHLRRLNEHPHLCDCVCSSLAIAFLCFPAPPRVTARRSVCAALCESRVPRRHRRWRGSSSCPTRPAPRLRPTSRRADTPASCWMLARAHRTAAPHDRTTQLHLAAPCVVSLCCPNQSTASYTFPPQAACAARQPALPPGKTLHNPARPGGCAYHATRGQATQRHRHLAAAIPGACSPLRSHPLAHPTQAGSAALAGG